jgi:hypothetical protein
MLGIPPGEANDHIGCYSGGEWGDDDQTETWIISMKLPAGV